MAHPPFRVLGVDTSLRSTGVGVVEVHGSSFKAVDFGLIANPAKRKHTECLAHIYAEVQRIIGACRPEAVAVEGIFFCRNVRTAITLGQARGAVLASCAAAGLPVYEYAPRRVKQAVVGTGSAHKEQVARMVMSILGLAEPPPEDAADALAMAICHLNNRASRGVLDPKEI